MYEGKRGAKRLSWALECTTSDTALEALATALRYEKSQLKQDIQALIDYIDEHEKTEDD